MRPIEMLLFLIGLSRFLHVSIGGTLFGPDLFLTVALFALLPRRGRLLWSGPFKWVIVFIGLWMLGQMITDIWRHTPIEDVERGWSKIVFFFLDFCGLALLTDLRINRVMWFVAGLSVSFIPETVFSPSEFQQEDTWKFGYAFAVTPLAAILASNERMRALFGPVFGIAVMAAVAVVNLLFNFRLMFALGALSAAYGAFEMLTAPIPDFRRRITPVTFALVASLGAGAGYGLAQGYGVLAGAGYLGADAQSKYLDQSGSDLSFLQAGRTESLVSTIAIEDSPILGHGSWARDPSYVQLMVELLEEHGEVIEGDPFDEDFIPSHSHLLGAWVEAGILGGTFWIFMFGLAVVAIYRSTRQSGVPQPFVVFTLGLMCWDILFSPFGADQRFVMASKICIAIWVIVRDRAAAPRRVLVPSGATA